MTTFFCSECQQPFHITDEGMVQSMVNWHLATGDGFVCPNCDEGIQSLRREGIPMPLYSFEETVTMRRIEKKLIVLIIKQPRTPAELVNLTGWTVSGINEALARLESSDDIFFDGKVYHTKRKGITELATKTNADNAPRRKKKTSQSQSG